MIERAGSDFDRAALAALLLSLPTLLLGGAIAWHHPSAPALVLSAFLIWCVTVASRPDLWLFALPSALPLLNFAPWTGWLIFDEFDLLLLGTLSGGYLRFAFDRSMADRKALAPTPDRGLLVLALLFAGSSFFALYRGFSDAGFTFGWYQGYADPLNSLRVFKGPIYALLLWPLLLQQLRDPAGRAVERLCVGILLGLSVVVLAVLWERAAFTGLWDFSTPYRTTALFWEMHVGGAAIDAYLALTAPFVAWALWSARSPAAWAAAAALSLVAFYTCLTTFSRGVYLSVGVPLLLLGLLFLGRQPGFRMRSLLLRALLYGAVVLVTAASLFAGLQAFGLPGVGGVLLGLLFLFGVFRARLSGWRSAAGLGLALALLMEVVAVFGSGTFMLSRLATSERDFGGRLAHWQNGLGLIYTPAEWAWGIGLGRLPASYARFVREREFSGSVQAVDAEGRRSVKVAGPKTQGELGGLYALTQRVPLQAESAYRAAFDVRVETTTDVLVRSCEMHLLYERRCQLAGVRLRPQGNRWQHVALALRGPPLAAGNWYAPRMRVFAVSVLNGGGAAAFDNMQLTGKERHNLLRNGDFSREMAHWFPAAQHYFLPWHIDNLYLELLIERGAAGLFVFIALAGLAIWRLCLGAGRRHPLAPFLAASLAGGLIVGMVSSVMDVPRVAFLFFLLLFLALSLDGNGEYSEKRGPPA
jgi:hypothetical protein